MQGVRGELSTGTAAAQKTDWITAVVPIPSNTLRCNDHCEAGNVSSAATRRAKNGLDKPVRFLLYNLRN